MKKLLALSFPVLLLAACTQASFAIANLPANGRRAEVFNDVRFGSEPWQKLDIYAPPGAAGKNLDVVVFIYGGRWSTGGKGQYKFVGEALAQNNFIAIIPDFRKYPDVKFPVFVEDAAKAVAWALDNARVYGGDPNRLHLAGHSSGAHVAALIATDPYYLGDLGKNRGQIRSFAGLSGPYAFTPDEPDLIDMFGPPQNYPRMQVPNFIDGKQPPMLLVHGGNDNVVGLVNIERMQSAVAKEGGCVSVKIYPGLSHTWTVGALSWLGKNKAPILQDMTDYFRASDRKNFCNEGERHVR